MSLFPEKETEMLHKANTSKNLLLLATVRGLACLMLAGGLALALSAWLTPGNAASAPLAPVF